MLFNAGKGTRWENGAHRKKMKEFSPIGAYLVWDRATWRSTVMLLGYKGISQWGWRSFMKVGQDLAGLWRYPFKPRALSPKPSAWDGQHLFPLHQQMPGPLADLPCGASRKRSCLSISSADMAKPAFLLGSIDCHHHILVPVWIPCLSEGWVRGSWPQLQTPWGDSSNTCGRILQLGQGFPSLIPGWLSTPRKLLLKDHLHAHNSSNLHN